MSEYHCTLIDASEPYLTVRKKVKNSLGEIRTKYLQVAYADKPAATGSTLLGSLSSVRNHIMAFHVPAIGIRFRTLGTFHAVPSERVELGAGNKVNHRVGALSSRESPIFKFIRV